MRTTGLLAALLTSCALAAGTEEPAPAPAAPRCEVAVVSPVSGFAECVQPRGVPVAPPPKRLPPSAAECERHADLELEGCPPAVAPPAPPD